MKLLTLLSNEIKSAISLDLRSIAIFRILLGTFLIGDLITRASDIVMFYTDNGVLPRNIYCPSPIDYIECNNLFTLTSVENSFSVHLANGSTEFQMFLFLLSGLFAFFLLVGYKSNWMAFLSWIMIVSIQNVNPIVLQGGDVVIRMTVFLAIFLPLSGRFSLDALIAKPGKERTNNKYVSLATLAFILQIAFIYFFAAHLKTGAEWRDEFTSVYYALSLEQFSNPIGEFLLNYPDLLKVLTVGTIYFEYLAGFLLLLPIKNWIFRTIGVFGLIALQLGFMSTMALGPFPIISIISFICLLPTEFWDLILKPRNLKKISFVYNKESLTHFRTYRLLKVFGLNIDTDFKSDEVKRIYVEKENKKYYSKDAVRILLQNSIYPSFLHKFISTKVYWKIYNKIFNNNLNKTPEFYTKDKEFRENDLRFFIFNFVPSIVIILVAFWNLANHTSIVVEKPFNDIVLFARFDQKWNMFAPYPLKESGWFIVTGFLNDGTEVNLFGKEKERRYDKPKDISSEFPNQRWRKYLMNLRQSEYERYRKLYMLYICKDWNTDDSKGIKMKSVQMDYQAERTLPDPTLETVTTINLITHNCIDY